MLFFGSDVESSFPFFIGVSSHERTEASKDLLLAAKNRHIKALEEENSRLQEDLKKALGTLYEKV
jgi:hypothetical protein